ncbi:hypothetical protein IM725_18275 [Ramlibacter aquaticus]|uniref:Nucleoside-diphosphate sugar epimerase n=1 Tax=Ramlibacter aquaticus TaxID=2780094 RepID=A0ABR9SJH0_9BURK|nr:hypothetical protein [Ramlibacter aquaticus]
MSAPGLQAPSVILAGATGVLGQEVLRRLAGSHAFRPVHVLAREPMRDGLRDVRTHVLPADGPAHWPVLAAEVAVVLFEPPRMFHERERALWVPAPEQLPELAAWLRRCGVSTLAVVLPHAQMRLPEALKRGLASLDEHAVVGQGFERLLIVRSAQKPGAPPPASLPVRVARGMLGVLRYMIPSSEQPVRAAKVAEFVAWALRLAPAGIHVAASETVWHAAQGEVRAGVTRWLAG